MDEQCCANSVKQMSAADEIKSLCEKVNQKALDLEKFITDKLSPH